VSSEAVNWVRDQADVPANLVSTMYVVASYMDEDGRGCWASIKKIAAGVKKSHRQAEKDVAMLRKMGMIAPGDQGLVAHIHPDHRPVVYDLPDAAIKYIEANPIERRPPVVRDGRSPRRTRRESPVVRGSNPPSYATDKTSPTGRDRAGRAPGSAQRTSAPATHAFDDDGHGNCAQPQCGLPAPNSRHKEHR
jgi:hypothetical protein